ncbi:tripartite tricarboxylate transporter substrate binding protein [Pigmentiphaga daeguensis]|uniref:Tripartite tricarboxylate transporter substrate binding protein n=1 Tax=Pigmentiphaga daeguensis TaxID=414049 RepID=A0ABP3MF12_9BURK
MFERILGMTLLIGSVCLAPVGASEFPAKPIRMLVTTTAGGPLDTFSRTIAAGMSQSLRQSVVVENLPGAGGNIAAQALARAQPDGYTLLMAVDTTVTVNPSLYTGLPFDPRDDLVPISILATNEHTLIVHEKLPAATLAELVGLSKQRPISYSTAGVGSPAHLAMASLQQVTGLRGIHVPYKGAVQSITDVAAGRVDASFVVTAGAMPHITAKRVRPLASSGHERSALLPEVPTVAELGYPGYEVAFAFVLFAPRNVPNQTMQLLSAKAIEALRTPEAVERLRSNDWRAAGLDPASSRSWLDRTRAHWKAVAEQADMRAD